MNEETMKIGMEAMREKFGDEAMEGPAILGEKPLHSVTDEELRMLWMDYVDAHLEQTAIVIGVELVKRGYEYDAQAEHWRRWDDEKRQQEVFESVAQSAYEKATGTDFASKIAALRNGEPLPDPRDVGTLHKPNRLIRWFKYEHLDEDIQKYSKWVSELAWSMDAQLPESAEKTTGLRKLLEAKDCFVRAAIELVEQQEDA